MSVTIRDELIETLDKIEPGSDTESKLKKILEEVIRYRLAGYELGRVDLRFRKKYNMTLKEFEDQNLLEKLGYSFEAESDYHDWDMAIDGIDFLKKELEELSRDYRSS
ncbi:hypothetical protein HYR99_25470 [Candidatus Poribacteria bacterium]|nr:hypothetical protein [Candidatus Poribacteria bacterium]